MQWTPNPRVMFPARTLRKAKGLSNHDQQNDQPCCGQRRLPLMDDPWKGGSGKQEVPFYFQTCGISCPMPGPDMRNAKGPGPTRFGLAHAHARCRVESGIVLESLVRRNSRWAVQPCGNADRCLFFFLLIPPVSSCLFSAPVRLSRGPVDQLPSTSFRRDDAVGHRPVKIILQT